MTVSTMKQGFKRAESSYVKYEMIGSTVLKTTRKPGLAGTIPLLFALL